MIIARVMEMDFSLTRYVLQTVGTATYLGAWIELNFMMMGAEDINWELLYLPSLSLCVCLLSHSPYPDLSSSS